MSVTTIGENSNNDIYLGNDGNIVILSDAQALAQICKSRVEAQRGEMKYNQKGGMPTRLVAFDTFNPAQFEAAFKSIIMATSSDILSIPTFSLTFKDNVLSYSAKIETSYGSGTLGQP